MIPNISIWYNPTVDSILPHLSFYKDGFGIKYPVKVDLQLNKETKPINSPSRLGCRIHWPYLGRGLRPPPSSMSVLDMTPNNLLVRLQ